MTVAADAAEKLRDRIVKLYAHLGADDSHETRSALRKLHACLRDNNKTFTALTLTIQDGLEQLALLSPDELEKECPYCQRIFASFASLLAAADDRLALLDAHEQIGAADQTESAQARQQAKAILERHGLNWTDLSNLLRHAMEDLEAWASNLLDEICDLLREYVTFTGEYDAVIAALWILHTFVYDRFMHTPRLGTFSYDAQSGKSVLVTQCMGELTKNPVKMLADKHVAASLYWTIDHDRPTVLLDEAQNAEIMDTLKSVINGGFDRSFGGIRRRQGPKGATVEYKVYAPFAFCWNLKSALAPLPDDTLSRCLTLDFVKTGKKQQKRFNLNNAAQMQEFADLKQRIEAWAINVTLEQDPSIPIEIDYGRYADCCRVLLSIADSLGRGAIARRGVIALSKRRRDEPIRARLLRDCRTVRNQLGGKGIRTEDLLKALLALEDCSLEGGEVWSYWSGDSKKQAPHALRKSEMCALLRTFPIKAGSVRYGTEENETFNGYYWSAFEPHWERHCPDHTPTQIPHLRVVND